jgi:hypothetical protein
MPIHRTITDNLHHIFVQYPALKPFVGEQEIKDLDGEKYSYISEFWSSNEDLHNLYNKIKRQIEIYDHVYVNLGQPGLQWKPIDDPIYPNGPLLSTCDYVNRFDKNDPVTFFANMVPMVPTNRPIHFINDMFFQGHDIYRKYEFCRSLLSKLEPIKRQRKYVWEAMFSRHEKQFHLFRQHKVSDISLSTCWPLGIDYYGADVKKPTQTPAEYFGVDNIRCSDLIDPEIYNDSYYSLVFETVRNDHFSMFSEKEAKPVMAMRPFIIFGSFNHLKAFRSLGFKTFGDVIDESYDDEKDEDMRFQKICDAMLELSGMDPAVVYKKLLPVLEHNKNHLLNHNWNQELLDSWTRGQVNF